LLGRLPANTAFFASIPNLGDYLGQAQAVFRQKMAESPELRAWWSGNGMNIEPILEKLRAASEYLGDEIVLAAVPGPDGHPQMPVSLANPKREAFNKSLKQQHLSITVITQNGISAFGPDKNSVAAVAEALKGNAFAATPFYQRIAES